MKGDCEEPPTPSMFQYILPTFIMELQIWLIVSIPLLGMIIFHYFWIMANRLFIYLGQGELWNTATPQQPTSIHVPPPRAQKSAVRKTPTPSKELDQIQANLEAVSTSLSAQLTDISKEARDFTTYVNTRQDMRYNDLSLTLEEIKRAVIILEKKIDHQNQSIEEKLKLVAEEFPTIEEFSNGVEDFFAGVNVPRPLLEKLIPVIISRLPSPTPAQGNMTLLNSSAETSPILTQQQFVPVPHHTTTIINTANIPPPKFHPNINTAGSFLVELEHYMSQKRIPAEQRIAHLQQVFGKEKDLNLWWQRAKLQVK